GLATLLGLPSTINGETLPEFMNRTTRAPAPRPDPVEAVLAEHRVEARREAAMDHEGMLIAIKARRISTFRNPQPGEMERQHLINKRLDEIEAQLTGGYDDEQR